MRFFRHPLTITAALIAVTAYAAPRVIWDPSGEEVEFRRKTGATSSELVGRISSTAGEPIEFNQGAKITAGKPLIADTIQTNTGANPPGMVPIGGTVLVFPHLDATNSWQPPATGVIKDGFMRADGNTVPTGQGSPLQGKTLPNMVGKYAKGGATSGATGGANTHTPTGTVSQPTFAGVAAARSTWFGTTAVTATGSFSGNAVAHSTWFLNETVTASFTGTAGTYTVSVPAHYHDFTGANNTAALASSLGISGSAPTLGGTTTFASSTHTHDQGTYMATLAQFSATLTAWKTTSGTAWTSDKSITVSGEGGGLGGTTAGIDVLGASGTPSASATVTISGGSYSLTGSNSVTGSIGYKPGSGFQSGNIAFNASGSNTPAGTVAMDATDDNKQEWAAAGSYTPTGGVTVTLAAASDNMADWAAAGSYTPTGTVSQPSFTGNSQNTEPEYVTGVWVIRVL